MQGTTRVMFMTSMGIQWQKGTIKCIQVQLYKCGYIFIHEGTIMCNQLHIETICCNKNKIDTFSWILEQLGDDNGIQTWSMAKRT